MDDKLHADLYFTDAKVPGYAQIGSLEGWITKGLTEYDMAESPKDTEWSLPERSESIITLVKGWSNSSYRTASLLLLKAGYNLMRRDVNDVLSEVLKIGYKLVELELATGYDAKPRIKIGLRYYHNEPVRIFIPHWLYPNLVEFANMTGIGIGFLGRMLFAYAIINSEAFKETFDVHKRALRDVTQFKDWLEKYLETAKYDLERAELVYSVLIREE